MQKLTRLLSVIVLVTGIISSPTAQASVIGDTINYQLSFQGLSTYDSGTVTLTDPAIDHSNTSFGFGSNIQFDFKSTNQLDLLVDLGQFIGLGTNNEWEFSGFSDVITSVTQIGGPTASISFTGNSINIITLDFSAPPTSNLYSFNINGGNAIPEPGSFALLSVALVGLGATRRKKAS